MHPKPPNSEVTHLVTFRRMATVVVVVALGASSCSDKTKDSASSNVQSAVSDAKDAAANVLDNATVTAVRNFATQQGEEQFANARNPLDASGLSCKATMVDGVAHVTVSCTGTTKDRKAASLKGETSEIPGASITELDGKFTGAVDGNDVFVTEKLGG